MKERFYLYRRRQTFYVQDSQTGKQQSLETKDRNVARRLLEIKRQAADSPSFNKIILKTCLSANDSLLGERTWKTVTDQMGAHGKESTKTRCACAFNSKWFNPIRQKKLIDTTADDFLAVLTVPKVSVNHYLRRLHNLAVGLGWLPFPILPPKLWPKPKFKEKRAITLNEHQAIVAAESNPERKLYYEFLWQVGASQSDAAMLTAEQIDWSTRTLSYQRMKTGEWAHLTIGPGLEGVLKQLPKAGPLFPKISATNDHDRSAEFYRRRKLLNFEGMTLHSYRYAWAERGRSAGYPERFAQAALGHASKAVHRAYSRRATVQIPPLDDYEKPRLPAA